MNLYMETMVLIRMTHAQVDLRFGCSPVRSASFSKDAA